MISINTTSTTDCDQKQETNKIPFGWR